MERRQHEVERFRVRRGERLEDTTTQAVETRRAHVQQVSFTHERFHTNENDCVLERMGSSTVRLIIRYVCLIVDELNVE